MENQNENHIQELFNKFWNIIFDLADELKERAKKDGLTDRELDFLDVFDELYEAIDK